MVRCNECESGRFATVRTACIECNGGSNFERAEGGKQVVREPIVDRRADTKLNLVHGGYIKGKEGVVSV